MASVKSMRGLAVAIMLFTLSACAGGEPLAPTKVDEIPSGPGMFTGKDGEFVIYRR